MIRILIVEDNDIKLNKIISTLVSVDNSLGGYIETADCVVTAKQKLASDYYDLVVLDVQLPNRSRGVPQKDAGLVLLKKIFKSDRYVTPNHVVGLTAYDDDIEINREMFGEEVCSLYRYDQTSLAWKRKITDLTKRLIEAKVASHALDGGKSHVVVTIHGIRTFGEWQDRLRDLLRRHGRDVDVYQYSYGFFSLFAYFLPPLRALIYTRFFNFLSDIIKSDPDVSIDVVAHSFGTKIVSNFIERSRDKGVIHTVILSGSVLSHNYPWNSHIGSGKVGRVVNDCGTGDYILWLNSFTVFFSGMAGYLGFSGGLNERLTNRYFAGGHDFCFRRNGCVSDDFMDKYWVPLIVSDVQVLKNDDRRSTPILGDISSFLLSFVWVAKLLMYSFFVYYFIV